MPHFENFTEGRAGGLLTTDPCLILKILPRVELGHGVSLVFVVVRCGCLLPSAHTSAVHY